MRKQVAAVFFDLDGTLADTAPDLGGALNQLLAEHGRPPLDMAVLRPHVSAGTRGMLGVGFALTPDQADYPPLAERFLKLYAARLCVGTRLFDGMPELLAWLEAHDIPWGVVTNKPARFTEPLLDALNLTHRCAAIVSGDSAAKPKPAPDLLLLAAARVPVPPTLSFYIGDDLRDIQAAHASGMAALAATWGYLGTDLPVDAWNADTILNTPLDVIQYLDA